MQGDADNEVLARALGLHYFSVMRFHDAVFWLERGITAGDPLTDLARRYANLKEDDRGLAADEMVDIIFALGNRSALTIRIALCDQRGRSLTELAGYPWVRSSRMVDRKKTEY